MATVPVATYQPNLAGNGDRGGFSPFEIFAGEKEIVHDRSMKAINVSWTAFQPLAKNANGELIIWDPTAAAPANVMVGVSAYPAPASATLESDAFYASAFLNHAIINWPASITTLTQRKQAVQGTGIRVAALR